MKKSDVPSAAELFIQRNVLSGRRESILFVSQSQEESKGTRTLAMHDISRAHFHGVPVRRVFVELLPDDDKEKLAREEGHNLEHVGQLRKCMYG